MTQTVLITGASSGIGKATAALFTERGWNVVATMRNPDGIADIASPAGVMVARLDVTDPASIERAVAAALARFGGIDVLVNNAGYGAYGPLEAVSMEAIRRQFETNVFGLLAVTKALLPHFRARRAGVVVNVSSMGGKVAFPLGTPYHGTKFAVEGISEALSYELAAIGGRVKIIEPGMVNTDFGGRSFDFSNDEALIEYQDLVQKTFAGFGAAQRSASEPALVAEGIYAAAVDDSDQLRYAVGADAASTLAFRESSDDTTFLQAIRDNFV